VLDELSGCSLILKEEIFVFRLSHAVFHCKSLKQDIINELSKDAVLAAVQSIYIRLTMSWM
jgi:hypothetical protein